MFSIVLGTRPEIIKMSPIIRACQKVDVDRIISAVEKLMRLERNWKNSYGEGLLE